MMTFKTPEQLGQEVYNAAVRDLKGTISPEKGKSWRQDGFTRPAKTGEFGAGLQTFSPALFMPGHEVSAQIKYLSMSNSKGHN